MLRVSYHAVMYEWDAVQDAILLAVRRGDHLRRGAHERLELAVTVDQT